MADTVMADADPVRVAAVGKYRQAFLQHRCFCTPTVPLAYKTPSNHTTPHRTQEATVKKLRLELNKLNKAYDKTESDLKAIQNVGQVIGEVLQQLDEDRFIIKASNGPR
jgi:hypothetical protein